MSDQSTLPEVTKDETILRWMPYKPFAIAVLSLIVLVSLSVPSLMASKDGVMTEDEALELGEEFGVVVGEVDEEIRDFLGLTRAEGVVVFEVIGGKPADLAGIKVRAVIKEIDKFEIKTLQDFGRALKASLPITNFTVATYEPADPDNQGVGGGINFHFVRIAKD